MQHTVNILIPTNGSRTGGKGEVTPRAAYSKYPDTYKRE